MIRHWRPPFELPPQYVLDLKHFAILISNPKTRLEVKLWVLWSLRNLVPKSAFTGRNRRRFPHLKAILNEILSSPTEALLYYPAMSRSSPIAASK
ncbi:unnamed protein product [Rodentolepis nana]|uniref:Uncharacterized protein n=1 Tax=Rodentolepis nana TaxID=102285 RepID=A0A0R3TEQ5_RODNA|nr:unnamed protein product [Rodentolepis nana]